MKNMEFSLRYSRSLVYERRASRIKCFTTLAHELVNPVNSSGSYFSRLRAAQRANVTSFRGISA
jgi:hypothetical protein